MLTDEMKSMAYLINKEILKIFPYEYIKDVCSGEITMKEIIDQIMMECCKYAYDNSLETHSLDYYMGGATKANDSDRMMYQRVLDYVRNKREIEQIELEKIVKERIEGGANEKAVLRLFINCPFVCINFDFFWLNKARQLYMDF